MFISAIHPCVEDAAVQPERYAHGNGIANHDAPWRTKYIGAPDALIPQSVLLSHPGQRIGIGMEGITNFRGLSCAFLTKI